MLNWPKRKKELEVKESADEALDSANKVMAHALHDVCRPEDVDMKSFMRQLDESVSQALKVTCNLASNTHLFRESLFFLRQQLLSDQLLVLKGAIDSPIDTPEGTYFGDETPASFLKRHIQETKQSLAEIDTLKVELESKKLGDRSATIQDNLAHARAWLLNYCDQLEALSN